MLEYFKDEKGEDRFRIKGENGEIIVTSEGYASKSNAKRGYWDLVDLLVDAHTTGAVVGAAKRHRHSAITAGAEDEPEGTKSAEGFQGSKHDEVPGDNPDAIRSDEDGGS